MLQRALVKRVLTASNCTWRTPTRCHHFYRHGMDARTNTVEVSKTVCGSAVKLSSAFAKESVLISQSAYVSWARNALNADIRFWIRVKSLCGWRSLALSILVFLPA